MSDYKFIAEYEGVFDSKEKVCIEFDAEKLDDVVETFQRFLLAVGFNPKGKLEFIEDGEVVLCEKELKELTGGKE